MEFVVTKKKLGKEFFFDPRMNMNMLAKLRNQQRSGTQQVVVTKTITSNGRTVTTKTVMTIPTGNQRTFQKILQQHGVQAPTHHPTPPKMEVEAVVDKRSTMGRTQLLVKWKHFPPIMNSWEWENDIKRSSADKIAAYNKRMEAVQARLNFHRVASHRRVVQHVPQKQSKRKVRLQSKVDDKKLVAAANSSSVKIYRDPDFKITDPSILGENTNKKNVIWLRPKDIHPAGAKFFVGGSESGDVVQGELGDCWFLSSLALLGDREDLIDDLLVKSDPELGYYTFRFYKNGEWKLITIDDRLPCHIRTKQPLYSKCKDPSEFWVPLTEKAFAKLHGSYAAIEGGSMTDGFVDLTGGSAEVLDFVNGSEDIKAQVKDGRMYKFIDKLLNNEEWLLGTSISMYKSTPDPYGVGLLPGHAYSIVDAKVVSGTPLICLRNPWGRKEWEGDWSDSSSLWTAQLQKANDVKIANDGTFWMSWDDFSKYYNKVFVCRLYQDDVGEKWKRYSVHDEWKGATAGGCRQGSNPKWIQNPQFGLTVDQDTDVFISVNQDDARVGWTPKSGKLKRFYQGFEVWNVDDNTKKRESHTAKSRTAFRSSPYLNLREVSTELTLKPGKYIIMATTFQPGESTGFTLVVHSQKTVKMHKILPGGIEAITEQEF